MFSILAFPLKIRLSFYFKIKKRGGGEYLRKITENHKVFWLNLLRRVFYADRYTIEAVVQFDCALFPTLILIFDVNLEGRLAYIQNIEKQG